MENIFLKFVNLSITAGWIVLAVVFLRFLLKKAPKWINCLLWAIVGVRLVLPFSLESVFSLIPNAETIPSTIATDPNPMINSGFSIVNNTINPIISKSFTPEPIASANPLQIILYFASIIWIIGIVLMIIYTVISYIQLRNKVKTATPLYDNIRQSEAVVSPFILGFIKPKIYLPYSIDEKSMYYIIAHEKAHLKRRDHIIKPTAFLILSVYWFNPLIWIAYILLCRDIELACDEKVIRDMEKEERRSYSKSLLQNSVNRPLISACPIAFGEVGVKERVKSVMSYKKPTFWIIIVAVIACVVTTICFLTNPKKTSADDSLKNMQIKCYLYKDSEDGLNSYIHVINERYFDFHLSIFSSYIPHGTYEINDEYLVLKTNDGSNKKYTFKVKGDSFIFDASKSSEIPKFSPREYAEPKSAVPDGAIFELNNSPSHYNMEYNKKTPISLKVNESQVIDIIDNCIIVDSENIQCNDSKFYSYDSFAFTVDNIEKWTIGDKVKILHPGEFAEGNPPVGTALLVSAIE